MNDRSVLYVILMHFRLSSYLLLTFSIALYTILFLAHEKRGIIVCMQLLVVLSIVGVPLLCDIDFSVRVATIFYIRCLLLDWLSCLMLSFVLLLWLTVL